MSALVALLLAFAAEEEFDPFSVDVADAIACKIDVPTFNTFAMSLGDADQVKARGWRKVSGKNSFLYEYRLPKPIGVAGHQTNLVALSSTAIMAVLNVADTAALARPEGITNAADPEPLIAGMVAAGDITPEQAKQIPRSNKFLGERTLMDKSERDEELKADFRSTIRRTISNVSTHPGKTLYGCAYKIDMKLDSERD